MTLITTRDELDKYVGKDVILRGVVTNTRIPAILGVDVCSDSPDLRGQLAEAKGILQKRTVTQEELDKEISEKGQFPNRGAGTFYCLIDKESKDIAKVKKPKNNS